MSRSVHLVGSVPMASAEEVFLRVSEALGPSRALERTDELFKIHPTATGWYRYRLRKGRSPVDVRFDNLSLLRG